MDALTSHCVRSDGERLDPWLAPAPSVLAEDGRGVLYALGADGVVRATPARHVNAAIRGSVDADATPSRLTPGGRAAPAVEAFAPRPPLDFEPRTLAVSPSGHFAVVGGLRVGASGRGPRAPPPASALAIVALRSDSGVRGDSLTARALLDEDGGDPDDPDGVARRSCRATPLLEAHFARSPSLRVLRASWHPAGDAHLVVLLSDGTLRVFDAAAGDGTDASAMEEQAFRLDPWGRGPAPGPYPLRPEMVDFAFAPPHGWGALSLILLGREGDVYTLCPFAPWGARYPRVTLEALVAPDDVSERWLRATFPTIRGAAARDDDPELEFEDRARFGGRRLGLDFDDEFDDDEEEEEEDPEGAAEESYGESDEEDAYASRRGGGEDESDSGAWRGGTVAARAGGVPAGRVAALRGPLPLGTDPIEGDGGVSGGGGALGRGVVARALAVAPFRAGDGGGALMAVAHQRDRSTFSSGASSAIGSTHSDAPRVAATLDIMILPKEPAPAWAQVAPGDDEAALVAAELAGGAPVRPTPLADDDDEGALPPLLAIDRVRLAVDAGPGPGPGPGGPPPGPASEPKTADELAPFVTVTWDPACRERVFCAAGGAAHAVTLAWLAEVEGAVDDDDDDANDDDDDGYSARDASGEDSAERASGTQQHQQHSQQQQQPALPIPSVVTLMDGAEPLLGMAPVGDPLAEGLVLTVDAGGTARGLHPAPPPPADVAAETPALSAGADSDASLAASLAAAAEASAELRALAAGPDGGEGGASAFLPSGAAGLLAGTVEGNAALASAAAALKARHLRFAHRVHAAARRHGARLAAELERQRAEAKAIEEGVRAVLRRREVLAGRIERGARRHEEARARLRALAELERELPHPLTRAEAAFRTTLRASEDDVPLLRAKLEELRRRAEAEAEDARGGGGSDEKKSRTGRAEPFSSSSSTRGLDPAVGAELRAQEAAIRANVERLERIERAVGSLAV